MPKNGVTRDGIPSQTGLSTICIRSSNFINVCADVDISENVFSQQFIIDSGPTEPDLSHYKDCFDVFGEDCPICRRGENAFARRAE